MNERSFGIRLFCCRIERVEGWTWAGLSTRGLTEKKGQHCFMAANSNAANSSSSGSGNKLNFSKIEHTKNIFVFGVKYGNAPSKRKRRAAKEFLIWFSFGAAAQRSMCAPKDRRPQPQPQPRRCPRRGIVCGAGIVPSRSPPSSASASASPAAIHLRSIFWKCVSAFRDFRHN